MTALAEQPPTIPKEGDDIGTSGSSGGGDGGVIQAIANRGSAEEAEVLYTCRMCRRRLFAKRDIEDHETATHSFHRRKSKGITSKGLCSSIFLAEPTRWMKGQVGEAEGKLTCPNKACGTRLGSFKWTGAQCSCGSWVTPALQFPRKNLDLRSTAPARTAPGTVVHRSLLLGLRPGQESGGGNGGADSGAGVVAAASGLAGENSREDERRMPAETAPMIAAGVVAALAEEPGRERKGDSGPAQR